MQKPSVLKKMVPLILALFGAATAITPAGTLIENVATLTYTTETGEVEVPSQPVKTVVNPICSVSVLPNGTVASPGQSASLMPGGSTVFRYTLTNSGNTGDPIPLSVVTDAASQFTPGRLTIHLDANGNGAIDPGEGPITSVEVPLGATANLLVSATTSTASRGNAYVNLIASCGQGGVGDNDNVALIALQEPANFSLSKTFTPAELKPGEETTVNITATNRGGPSGNVSITDFLNTPDMKDFVYVSGSARASGGTLEFTPDGSSWNTAESTSVQGLRVQASSVPAGGTLTLSFRLRAPLANAGTRRNVARLISENQQVDAPADVTVKYTPRIALGPIGNPEANPGGELSADDTQVKSATLVNQEICFAHTVQNLGELEDTITTTGTVQKGAATVVFKDMNGTVITEPFQVKLVPQAKTDFQACYTPTQAGGPSEALKVLLTSTSGMGAAPNSTIDIVNNVGQPLQPPVKTGSKGSDFVNPGEQITYTLTFTNNQTFPLTNVVVRDELNNMTRGCLAPSGLPGTIAAQTTSQSSLPQTTSTAVSGQATGLKPLEFVSATQGGTLEGSTVVWRFPTVAAGQTVSLTVTVRVPAGTPECVKITNIFTVASDEIPTPVPSNPVTNTVYDPANLSFSKTSVPPTVVVGEQVTYILRTTNNSANMTVNDVKVTDTFPKGLKYIEGSSTLDGAAITPTVTTLPDGRLQYTWSVPGLAPNATAEIRFRALVTPESAGNLQNSATATAVADGRVVQTPTQVATTKIQPLSFGPNNADIVGYVFIDRNRNGVYDYGSDTPVQNARVILANGRIELTDSEGRYHYRNVREGEWAVRLDPNSVWHQNLSVPMDAGRQGSRLTYVRNLTSIDFPLAPNGGDIAVIRDTRMTMTAGPKANPTEQQFTVRKQVFVDAKDPTLYTVQLNLTACADLKAFTLTDPLPQGATLVGGQHTLNIDPLPNGERTLVYQFHFTGDVKAAVTDPTANWRY